MSLTEYEQIKKLLESKKDILITFQPEDTGDAIASSVALALFLESLGKRVDIVSQNFVLPNNLKFLKKSAVIKNNFSHLQKFVITVNTDKTGVHELSYDLKDEKLRIFVTPKQGFLTRDDVRTAQSDFKYDLIFVLNTQELSSLGSIYDNNTELFYNKPVINIDHHTGNEHFGQINLIDSTATSVGEILANMLDNIGNEHMNEDVATALLTAIIVNTHSFKTQNIKPNTLNLASKLMSLGADRDYIVQNLYRTRSLSTLKLWGQALSHIQHDKSNGLVWTTITRDDFVRSGAEANELYDIVEELISNSPEANLTILFYEQNNNLNIPSIHVILKTNKNYNAHELLKSFQPTKGDKKQAIAVIQNKTLKEVEEEVIAYIKRQLAV
ncbi:MAG: DHH family phosphoesterase [Candidatus Magasanikiibacteriota bacterium]